MRRRQVLLDHADRRESAAVRPILHQRALRNRDASRHPICRLVPAGVSVAHGALTTLLAAVDLGSNSFHLQIGRVVDGQIYPLDTLREVVRLGAGLTRDKRIDRATQARALEALARSSASACAACRASAVRAVGTNALRVAKNAPQFLREARAGARASRSK